MFTVIFWRYTGIRAARTALAALVPLIPALILERASALEAASIVAMATILSVLTALASLPEGRHVARPLWQAITARAVRTFAQVLAAGIGTAVLLTDVSWQVLASQALAAAAVTVVMGLLTVLPETETPVPPERLAP